MASIRPIDTTSIHRIHSGQVVLDLQSCLKEIVENSLDAGATSIEVRLKDSGTTSLEVSDNGRGIPASDWPSIGLKHHTSKFPNGDLSLLSGVQTFGFRGEALSALCALCEGVQVVTATEEMEPMGAVIRLGRDGRVLDSEGRVARPRGTTITLTNLFAPLPVRRKEFERNAKRELTKALTLLTAYALVPASSTPERSGVRIKVDHLLSGKTKRSTLLSNDGRGDLGGSVQAVWGSKAMEGVGKVDLELDVQVDKMARRYGAGLASGLEGQEEGNTTQKVLIKGLLSSAAWGQGRSSPDRQYFYVNGRPADMRGVQKVVNETYKSYNTHQVPLAILDFIIPRDSVDINVSPDKRTILLHSESYLLSSLRTRLEEYFAPSRNQFVVEGATQNVRSLKATQSKLDMGGVGSQRARAEEDNQLALAPEEGEEREVEDQVHRSKLGEIEGNAEAGPSRPRSRTGREVVTILDEDEDEIEASTIGDRPSFSVTSLPRNRPIQRPLPVIASPAISPASPGRKKIQGVIPTSTASWADNGSKRGKTEKKGVSGREARQSLRERLKVYSQAVVDEAPDDDGDMMEEAENVDDEDDPGEKEGDVVLREEEDGPEEVDVDTDRTLDDSTRVLNAGYNELEDVDDGEDGNIAERVIGISEDDDVQVIQDDGGDVRLDGMEDNIISYAEGKKDSDDLGNNDEVAGIGATPARVQSIGATPKADRSPSVSFCQPTRTTSRSSIPSPTAVTPPNTVSSGSTPLTTFRSEIPSIAPTGEITLSFSLPRLQARYAHRRPHRLPDPSGSERAPAAFPNLARSGLTSDAGVHNKDQGSAESALSRVISKADFGDMEVVGQFNKGFIIARLRRLQADRGDGEDQEGGAGARGKREGTDDLFIVDQHASDEKYNFETLQRTTRIKGQALIKPRPLELTAADELTAIEHLDILKANGFDVDVDDDKPPGRGERVKLVAMPISKETVFDFKDLEQLLHLLSDSSYASGQMVRCSKARSMFAMRACRKSVMIGKSLTKGQMTQLLRNMGTIDQPWNCPHGRPTMRHLTKIEPRRDISGKGRIDWARWAVQDESI